VGRVCSVAVVGHDGSDLSRGLRRWQAAAATNRVKRWCGVGGKHLSMLKRQRVEVLRSMSTLSEVKLNEVWKLTLVITREGYPWFSSLQKATEGIILPRVKPMLRDQL
jgi:hypothetical protein